MVHHNSGGLKRAVWFNPLFQICTFLYVLHSVWRQLLLPEHWLLQNYLNDLLCLPLVLSLAVFLQRHIVLRQPAYSLSGWQIGLVVAYFSVTFEGIFPWFMPRYTADIFDVAAYVAGGWLFYRFGNAGGTGMVDRTVNGLSGKML
ncbi:MAG TPA: hypothetical protein VK927_11450 [Adhaeribacter sp.]|nr:hypothetical protein [Adhaeribacter sp.]